MQHVSLFECVVVSEMFLICKCFVCLLFVFSYIVNPNNERLIKRCFNVCGLNLVMHAAIIRENQLNIEGCMLLILVCSISIQYISKILPIEMWYQQEHTEDNFYLFALLQLCLSLI